MAEDLLTGCFSSRARFPWVIFCKGDEEEEEEDEATEEVSTVGTEAGESFLSESDDVIFPSCNVCFTEGGVDRSLDDAFSLTGNATPPPEDANMAGDALPAGEAILIGLKPGAISEIG